MDSTKMTKDSPPQLAPPSASARAQVPQPIRSAPPERPIVHHVEDDISDDAAWRLLQARHIRAQTLSLQRTEWFVRSVRTYVLIWFWLSVVGAVVAGVLVAIFAGSSDASSFSTFP
jgi:hypothetical protein